MLECDQNGFGVFLASFAAGAVACYFLLLKLGKLVKKAPKDAPKVPPGSGPRGDGSQIP